MNGEGHHITSLKPTEMKKVWMDIPNYSKYKDPAVYFSSGQNTGHICTVILVNVQSFG